MVLQKVDNLLNYH